VKWKLLLRQLSVSAPHMTVRSRLPLSIRALMGFLVLALAAAVGVWLYDYGRSWAGPDRKDLIAELERVQSQLREVRADRDRYIATANALENQIKIERSSQVQLAQQAGQLEADRNRMREDLAFFESLLPTKAGEKGVVIRSFRMQADGQPNQMRYRLLVQQAGRPQRDFVGSVKMLVNLTKGGRAMTLELPDPEAPEMVKSLELSFRHYQRVEGGFSLPAGAVAQSVLVRILADGETRAQQNFTL